jgi:hypothetical protein
MRRQRVRFSMSCLVKIDVAACLRILGHLLLAIAFGSSLVALGQQAVIVLAGHP